MANFFNGIVTRGMVAMQSISASTKTGGNGEHGNEIHASNKTQTTTNHTMMPHRPTTAPPRAHRGKDSVKSQQFTKDTKENINKTTTVSTSGSNTKICVFVRVRPLSHVEAESQNFNVVEVSKINERINFFSLLATIINDTPFPQ